MLTTKEAFYAWYLSTDWILRDTVIFKSGGSIPEYSVDRSIQTE